jgi:hypothetical protein
MTRFLSWRCFIPLCFLAFVFNTNAATYYVSTSGNDGNNGTSQGAAWATLSKVSSATLGSGDVVLFQRGGTWTGDLTIGTAGVSYGLYGSGSSRATFQNSHMTFYAGNTTVDGFTMTGDSWFDVWSGNNTFQNCLFDNGLPREGGCWEFRDNTQNNVMRFCTVSLTGQNVTPVYFMSSNYSAKWYGCIFLNPGPSHQHGWGLNVLNLTGTDYNFYGSDPYFNFGHLNFAGMQSGGLDLHSANGDPLWVNSAGGDYTLQSSSPCKDTAGGVPVTPSPDLAGNARPQGSAADMGCYEYGTGGGSVPVITSSLIASGTVNQAFSYQITANNSPTNYGATGLPTGLGVNAGSGLISGTPSASGTFYVGLSAVNSYGTGTATLTLTIGTAAAKPVITSPTTASGTVGQPFSYQITATGNPTNYTATGRPAGLNIDKSTGLISGTPTQIGTNVVTLSAMGAGGTGTTNLTVTITAAGPEQAVYQINCGELSTAVPPFAIDQYFSGGGPYSTTSNIDLSGVVNPAPLAVYQTDRFTSNFGYDFSNLTAGTSYKVRLHFAELFYTTPGSRIFDVYINSAKVITNLDLVVAVGVRKALIKEFTVAATSSGQINFWFGSTVDNAKINGIEIWTVGSGGSTNQSPRGVPYSWFNRYGVSTNYAQADDSDTDGDGMKMWEEYYAGTDPTSAASVFRFVKGGVTNGSSPSVWLRWYGTTNSGVTNGFSVYRSTNIAAGSWQMVGTNLARSATGTNAWTGAATFLRAYYRVSVPIQ